MLKEAIAEAKTIKETAIANAKAALEEAFTPQLTAMFAERLNEDEEEEQKENYSMEEEELEEDFNLEEILAELSKTDEANDSISDDTNEGLDENIMLEEMSDEEIEELVMKVIDDMIETGKLMPGEGEEGEEEDMDDMDDMDDIDDIGGEEDEEIKLDELLNELLDEEKEKVTEVSNYVDDYLNNQEIIAALIATLGITAVAAKDYVKTAFQSLGDKAKKAIDKLTETAEAPEMEETINELRNELNEVNLLNAKLLYTNKIFKAKNLTESEKIKVLNTFDKAETVKEVKLVFETLTESFIATAKKAPIKESLGSASRSIASTQTKQPIIEVNDAFARMQKLAGLRK